MPDYTELVKTLKQSAVEAVEATKPVNVCFGTVTSASPLKINVEQKMTLGAAQLILCRNVTDFTTQVTVDWDTSSESVEINESSTEIAESSVEVEEGGNEDVHTHTTVAHTHTANAHTHSTSTHAHAITGRKSITVHNGLGVGDEVILLRQQGGQKYIVVDRIG